VHRRRRLHASSEDAAFAVTIVAASALTRFFVTALVAWTTSSTRDDSPWSERRLREIAATLLASAISVPALALIVVAVALSALD
jgi:ABC-2 type transport system permease protein